MDYPATQMFVNDDDDQEEEDEDETDAVTPLRPEKKFKVGVLLVDSITHPVYKGDNKIGRTDLCSIVIDHNTISKEHAEIEAGAGSKSTFISDLGSLNKTRLNDAVLRPGRLYQLQDGDVVRFGSVKAVFKTEKDLAGSRSSDDFVVPETPAPIAKEVHPIIPGTPDLSLDGSRGSDVSLIAGTQDGGRTSPRLSRKPSSQRLISREQRLDTSKDATVEMSRPQDISELETQQNFNVPDSDEESIFDMVTQQSDIHDDETQKLSVDNVHAVMLSKYTVNKVQDISRSIEDMETQKISNDDAIASINDLETQKLTVTHVDGDASVRSVDRIKPSRVSFDINDLETQKFGAPDPPPQSRRSDREPDWPVPVSINDLETQKFAVNDIASGDEKAKQTSYSINDLETQRPETLNKDEDDSETDEEGIFENSDGSVDMFNAPTQVIRTPHEVQEKGESGEDTAAQSTQRGIPEVEDNDKQDEELPGISGGAAKDNEISSNPKENNEEKRTTLNDSIESKLNHMFDDVNESGVEEPTQMLTQHLENILESTQVGEGMENADSKPSTVGDNSDGDNQAAKSDDEERRDTPKKKKPAVIRVPEIISTQELFADLPAVNIFRTPRRGRIKVSPMSDGSVTPKSVKSRKSESRSPETVGNTKVQSQPKKGRSNPKRAGSAESVESISSKVPKIGKEGESEAAENQTPSKASGRKKPKVEESDKEMESRKGLPLKKRGSSIISSPKTPKKTSPEVVVSNTRTGTRSSVKVSAESGRRSSRSSNLEEPKVPETKRPSTPKSSKTAKTEASSHDEKNLIQNTPQSRRGRKKALDTSAEVNDEEVCPAKRPRTTTAVLPVSVNDRGRGKRTTANENEGENRKESISTSSRRAKLAGNTSLIDSKRSSSMAVESLNNESQQSSLESQEIQAILGVIDKEGGNVSTRRGSRFRGEVRVFRSHEVVVDSGIGENRVSSRPGVTGFPETEVSGNKEVRERFEKPVGRAVRNTRNTQKVETQTEEKTKENIAERNANKDGDRDPKTAARTRRGRIAEVADGDDSIKTQSGGHAEKENFVKKVMRKVRSNCFANNNKPEEQKHPPASGDEVKVEDPPPLATVAQKTPKVQPGKRETSRRSMGKEGSEKNSPPKRGRRKNAGRMKTARDNSTLLSDEEVDASQTSNTSSNSSPLRRGRSSLATPNSATASSAKIKHRILFTGLNDPGLVSIVSNLGGTVTEKPNDCTALVTDKVRRTYKFLCGMAMAVPIVSIEWLKQSERKGCFLETGDFLLKDPVEEAKFKFDLRRSLARATAHKLLDGYTVVLTPNTAPPPIAEMKGIIQACGGKALVRPPPRWPEKSLIISRQEDVKNAKKFLIKAPKSARVLSVEFILTGILRHELNFEEHKLEID